MVKRGFDIIFSVLGIIITCPLLIVIIILIKIDSSGSVLFIQNRVGRFNKEFKIFKFRTMKIGSENLSNLSIGDNDERITKIGYYLRRYKLDELPQLFNVLFNSMSFVGPRPELRYFVDYYSKTDLEILNLKPGITDYASIAFRNEAELLKQSDHPEKHYINTILPKKIELNKQYLKKQSFFTDISIIFKSINTILFS